MTATHHDVDGTTDKPLIRRLRFAEDALMALHSNLLREAAETPLADQEQHGGLYDAATRVLRAADELRFVRVDVAELGEPTQLSAGGHMVRP
ncbi:hypothetical protein [[Mycobacterium] nativiensis]|uniref:Uncharacterized protein n=1 Tax=[Mycobacterium] nativiensis TaxID=2855503 RepID=A0ABU5Y685_9MYCO|nr:hypothetical protein [Mycolicibacter sp. MYC340]MEB3034766.1 hypothetical protein [Mycolicibacter sp. MYC340]